MRFSVIIPVYNSEKYLSECLDSFSAQSCKDFELIITDDGSTDKSGEICESYVRSHPFARVIHEKNSGPLAARLKGIEQAQGEYCIFADADDKVKPQLLSEINSYIEKYGADIVLYSFEYYSSEKTLKRNKRLFDDGQIFKKDSRKALYESYISSPDFFAIWTKCIKTEILKSDPTDFEKYYGLYMGEDVLLSLYSITAAQTIVFADKELYLYRSNPESLSNKLCAENIKSKNPAPLFDTMRHYLERWEIDDEEHRKRLDAFQFSLMIYFFMAVYKSADKKEKILAPDFGWADFLPENFSFNEYCSEAYTKVYKLFKEKDIKGLNYFFLKKRMYGRYKALKRAVREKIS